MKNRMAKCSVAYPDPESVGHVCFCFSTRYGSGSFYNQAKIVRKPYFLLFVTFYDFLSLTNNVNVASNSRVVSKKSKKKLIFVAILIVTN
jgi:hypothetical protein